MKKSILTIVMVIFAITAFAQNETEFRTPSGYQGFLEYGNSWHFNKALSTGINLSTTHGFYYNGHVFVGVGFGFDTDLENYTLVPFYANLRYVFTNGKLVSPVASLRLGSYLSDNIGAYGELAFGVRFASKRDFAVSIMAVGTYYDKIKYGHNVYDENGCYVQYVTEKISPSSISLRFGIEW